jgi:endonuclease VIII
MPEGHTLHRLARSLNAAFAGEPVASSSPQGRFESGASLIDGLLLAEAQAWGKHLLVGFARPRRAVRGESVVEHWVHVHLGLYGRFPVLRHDEDGPPDPRGALRWRLANEEFHADLRGPTACSIITDSERQLLLARLGPDLLRDDDESGDRERMWNRVSRSRAALGSLLMDQSVVAGIGNVYRAEVLFRAGIDPLLPGNQLTRDQFDALWADARSLLRSGLRTGRIVTTRPVDRDRPRGAVRRDDAHYVYRRAGQPCRMCHGVIASADLQGRNLFWCPGCQRG